MRKLSQYDTVFAATGWGAALLSECVPNLTMADLEELSHSSPFIKTIIYHLLNYVNTFEETRCWECNKIDPECCDGQCEDCATIESDLEAAGLGQSLHKFRELRESQLSLASTCDRKNIEIEELRKALGVKREFEIWEEKLNKFIPNVERQLDL